MQLSQANETGYRNIRYDTANERDWVRPSVFSRTGARKVLEAFGVLREPQFPQFAEVSEALLRRRQYDLELVGDLGTIANMATAETPDTADVGAPEVPHYSDIELAEMKGISTYILAALNPPSDEVIARSNSNI